MMFDAGFNKYLTLTIIKIVWAISIALAILTAIGGIIYGFIGTSGEPVFNEAGDVVSEGERTPSYLTVILSPIVAAVWLLFVRIGLELVAVIFKIADHVAEMARGT